MEGKALIIVDVQNDFCAGGALAVEEGDKVVPVINDYIEAFRQKHLPIYATRDWHPAMTHHFKDYGGLWPPHCVQNTKGAEFHPDLHLPEDVEVVSAGVDPNTEGYSGFEGKNEEGVSFETSLRMRGITHIYVAGIATDYCVKETVIAALQRGFKATLLTDAIKGVNLKPDDSEKAISAMVNAGSTMETLDEVTEALSR